MCHIMCKRIFRFELWLSSYWQNIDFFTKLPQISHMGDYINKAAKLWHGLFSNYLFKYHSKSTMSLHIIMCWSGLLKMVKPEIVWRILWIITPQNPLIYRIFYIHSVTWKPKGQKGCYTDYLNSFWSQSMYIKMSCTYTDEKSHSGTSEWLDLVLLARKKYFESHRVTEKPKLFFLIFRKL